jgi:hypothetical protein
MPVATQTTHMPQSTQRKGIAVGLIVLGSLLALCIIVALAAVGLMFATGTIRHTDQGWVFRSSAGTALSAAVMHNRFDAKSNTLLLKSGSGPAQTRQLTSTGSWIANWRYSCPTDSGSFSLVAQGQGHDYPAGALDHTGTGAGQSNDLPAGTYSLKVTTDSSCSWSVGAQPNN